MKLAVNKQQGLLFDSSVIRRGSSMLRSFFLGLLLDVRQMDSADVVPATGTTQVPTFSHQLAAHYPYWFPSRLLPSNSS